MIPIVLCIDVEPDLREPEPGAETRWDGWDWAYTRFGTLRDMLRARTGRPAQFNWFLRIDPQIAVLHGDAAYSAKRDRARFTALNAAGDEIGLHPHFWRRDAEDRGWFTDFADCAWVERVIADSVTLFRDSLGFAPTSFRAGDGLIDDAMVRTLPRLGIRYELTVEPRRRPDGWAAALPGARGDFPNTETVPREPYRPSRRDYRRPAGFLARRLWIVPVSMTPLPGGRDIDFTALNLVLPWNTAVFDALIAGPGAPFIVAVMRAGDLSMPHWRTNFEANLDALLEHPRAADFAFVTPAALVAWHRAAKSVGVRNTARALARKPEGGGARQRPV